MNQPVRFLCSGQISQPKLTRTNRPRAIMVARQTGLVLCPHIRIATMYPAGEIIRSSLAVPFSIGSQALILSRVLKKISFTAGGALAGPGLSQNTIRLSVMVRPSAQIQGVKSVKAAAAKITSVFTRISPKTNLSRDGTFPSRL